MWADDIFPAFPSSFFLPNLMDVSLVFVHFTFFFLLKVTKHERLLLSLSGVFTRATFRLFFFENLSFWHKEIKNTVFQTVSIDHHCTFPLMGKYMKLI